MRFLVWLVLAVFGASTAQAGRVSQRSGELKDNVYTDNSYDFSITLLSNWKGRTGKEKDKVRLTATQVNYDIPAEYAEAPDYTQVPRIVIYADTSTMSAAQFLDSIVLPGFKSKQKNEMLKEFEFLLERDIVPRGRRPIDVGGVSGMRWDAQAKYIKDVQLSASATSGTRVNGSYGGSLISVKKGSTIFVIYLTCEWDYFEAIQNELFKMLAGFSWEPATPAEK